MAGAACVPLSIIIRLTMDHLRDDEFVDKSRIVEALRDWHMACNFCHIPVSKNAYNPYQEALLKDKKERDVRKDIQLERFKKFRDMGLKDWIQGRVYEFKGKEYLVVASYKGKGDYTTPEDPEDQDHTVWLAPVKHFIFDMKLSSADYTALADCIHSGWAEWMELIQRFRSDCSIPRG